MTKDQGKRALLFCFLLVAILLIVEWGVDAGAGQSHYSHYYKVNLIANHQADPVISCFGSSVGEVALASDILERKTRHTVYNFCLDGTRFMQYNGLIRELNEYSDSCALVVMAETFFSLSSIDQLTEVDRFIAHISNDNIYGSLHAIQPELSWKLKYVPFYKFVVAKHSYYKASALGLRAQLGKVQWTDSLKGYTPRNKEWEADQDYFNTIAEPVPIKIDSAVVREYRKTIDALREKGRKVLIIIPPIQENGLRLLPDLEAVRKILASMQGDGVYFRDYSRSDLSYDKKYFYNNSHVNATGAEIFSARLASSIDSIMSEPKSIVH
jgi:hypothetical protein